MLKFYKVTGRHADTSHVTQKVCSHIVVEHPVISMHISVELSQSAEGVNAASANKRLKLLATMASFIHANESTSHQFPTTLTKRCHISRNSRLPFSIKTYRWRRQTSTSNNLEECSGLLLPNKLARVYLTPNASPLAVEDSLSANGQIKNYIVPYRLNKVCFVHDNYAHFFPFLLQ